MKNNKIELALEDVCLNAGKELADTPIKKPDWREVALAFVTYQAAVDYSLKTDRGQPLSELKEELHEKLVELDIAQYIKWD